MAWRNRSLCDVLQEMRTCTKTNNYSYLEGLIEEAQYMGTSMEAALRNVKDINGLHDSIKELVKKREALEKELPKEDEKDNQ